MTLCIVGFLVPPRFVVQVVDLVLEALQCYLEVGCSFKLIGEFERSTLTIC